MITLNSHRTSKSRKSISPKKKKKQCNLICQLLLHQVQSYQTTSREYSLHVVNMYANFLTATSSACYYCLDSSYIKLNHVNTVQMTNAANFSAATRQLVIVSPCLLRQKHIHVINYACFCTTLHGPIAVAPRPVMSTTADTPHTPTNVTVESSHFLNYMCIVQHPIIVPPCLVKSNTSPTIFLTCMLLLPIALHCISSKLLHQVQSYQVNSLHVSITIMQLTLQLYQLRIATHSLVISIN